MESITAFNNLNDAELEVMHRAPLLACILIAGADGRVDRKEMKRAVELSHKKTRRAKGEMFLFYSRVAEDFEDKLKIVMQGLPLDAREQARKIVAELSTINGILPKVDKQFAKEFYASLKYIAAQVAASSGGLLGIKSVGEEEEKYVDLLMIKAPA